MSKNMNEKELNNLIKLFRSARDQLLDTIINYHGVGTKVYANTILRQVMKQLEELEKATGEYAGSVIPAEYQKALDDVYTYFKKNKLLMKPPALFAQLHNDAIYAIAREMQYQIGQGLEQVGRQILRYVDSARDNALRMAGLEATGEKLASGATVRQMKENLIRKLQDEGFFTVQYGQGKNAYQVSLDTYAAMVARSTTREAGNIARENQLVANGYDLVRMSTHYPTCHICAPLQGRVYSITGKDKRFPALMETAFKSGYHNIHPNCRHVIGPYIEQMKEPEELAADIERSNRPFEDTRSQKEIDLYNEQQKRNRQIRQDRYQYERYKMVLGEDAPKTFSAFRRMKKANSVRYQALKDQYALKTLATSGIIKEKIRSSNTSLGEPLDFMTSLGQRYIPKSAEIKGVHVIAAPELKKKFRSAHKRSAEFGGVPEKWVKKVGKIESDKYIFDVHWEENIDVGRVNWKIKNIKEKMR